MPQTTADTSGAPRDRLIEAITDLIQANAISGHPNSAWEETRRVVQEYRDVLLTDEGEEIFARVVRMQIEELDKSDADERSKWYVQHSLVEKWDLLRRCREDGIDNAFDELRGRLIDDWKWYFLNFLSWCSRADNWPEIRDALRDQYREVLSPRALAYLEVSPWEQSWSVKSITLGELIGRITDSDFDLDVAFEDLVEFGTDVPASLREPLRAAFKATSQYQQSGDRISLNKAIDQWESVVEDRSFATASRDMQRTYLLEAGDAYEYRFREREDLCDLTRAITLWQRSRQGGKESAPFLYYLGYSYERRYQSSSPPQRSASNSTDRSDLDLAIEFYDRAYDAADDATDDVAPAPTEGATDAFTNWMWLRRQKGRYRNAAGTALLERYRTGQSVRDLNAAVDRCRAATELAEEEELRLPFLYDDLAQTLMTRFMAIGENSDLQAAVSAYEEALKQCHGGDPLIGLETATHYGLLLYDLDEFAYARTVLEAAHGWAEASRMDEQTSHRTRQSLADLTVALYETLVTCCLHDGDATSAFQYAVAAKGRSLADALMASRVDLATLLKGDSALAADLAPYLQLRDKIDAAKVSITHRVQPLPGREPNLQRSEGSMYKDLEELRHQEKHLWADLASRHRILAAMGAVPPMTATDASHLANHLGSTLVEYYRHRQGWCAFVVTAEQVVYQPLPDVTEKLLDDVSTWVRDISQYHKRDQRDAEHDILTRWYDAVVRPIRDLLPSPGSTIIAPFGRMHLLPYCAGIERDSGRYVLDEFDLGFAPSLSAIGRIWQRVDVADPRRRRQPLGKVLGVAYPGPPGRGHLENAFQEVASVLECFDRAEVTKLPAKEEEATPDNVIACARGQDVIHICCHGLFDPRYPVQSGLKLEKGWLTARRIATELDLRQARLFTMSACISAMAEIGHGDELEGLTQAAMTAGAPTVVSSLWPVDDPASEALMMSFYRNITQGSPPIQAMQAAARSVREKRDEWGHPYYWCGFIVSGLGQLPLSPPPYQQEVT